MKSTVYRLLTLNLLLTLWGCRPQKNPPELTGVSPNQAFVGQEVTLTGHQFGSEPTVIVGSGALVLTATLVSHDEETITIKVPYVAPGIAQIRVQTDQGTSDPLPLTVRQPSPEITAVNPGNGLPGTPITITGDFLNRVSRVRFDNVNAVVKDSSAQQLTVLVPANTSRGPVVLSLETQGGLSTYGFIVAGTPQITSLTPQQIKPGAELVIKGVNLTDGIVRINGRLTDQSQTRVSDTEIHTIVPTEATSGLVTVTVFDKLIGTSADTLQVYPQPVLYRLQISEGVANDKLILEGRNLNTIASVWFGNVTATYRPISDTQVEVTVPALAASGPVTISANSLGGNANLPDPFFFYLPPSELVITPARQIRQQPITISGKNLYRITDVRVSGISVSISSRTEGTDLQVDVPATAVSGPVTVVSRAGTAATPLIVVQKAIATTILPMSARPGERIVIQGGFLMDAQIYFSGSVTPAADAGKNTDTERWVLVPTDAQTGPLRIINATNDATVTTTFTVLP